MFNLLIYSVVIIIVVNIALFRKYLFQKNRYNQKSFINDEVFTNQMNKAPIFNIFLIAIILSLYSAYLATSGYLTDTERYAWSFLYRYPAYNNSLMVLFDSGTEIGFLLINILIAGFTDNPYWLFLIVGFITTFINLYSAAKISKSYTLLVFLYLVSLYFFYSTFLLRQILAVSFVNLAFISYLREQKYKYFFYCIVALSFHATSLILFPIFFIFKKVKTSKDYFYLIIISIIVFISFGSIFNVLLPKLPYINQFLNVEEMNLSTGGGSFTSIFKGIPYYLLTILAIVRRNKLKQMMYKADFYILCSVFYSISWLLTYNMYWFFRMGMYFLLPTLVLVPNLFSTIRNPKRRILYYFIFIFTLIIITYRQIFITLL
ncbi:EpsG family protein [Lysinibacillus xylanilyticus]|uniref:EpsG family protein n=1 Tax=Lysinibacillus xylanilyticus TaxID=582475 RepID=UPI0038300604